MDFIHAFLALLLAAGAWFHWVQVHKYKTQMIEQARDAKRYHYDQVRPIFVALEAAQVEAAKGKNTIVMLKSLLSKHYVGHMKSKNTIIMLKALLSRHYVGHMKSVASLQEVTQQRDSSRYCHRLFANEQHKKSKEKSEELSRLEADLKQSDASLQEAMDEITSLRRELLNLEMCYNSILNQDQQFNQQSAVLSAEYFSFPDETVSVNSVKV